MPAIVRVLVAAVLVAVTAFCVFGYLATYEPPADANIPLRIIYAVIGVGCLALATWLAWPRRPSI